MDGDYPEELLAREPAPPYAGEGPFALWHFSEDPALGRFEPRVLAGSPGAPPLVWAVDTRHAPMFWFPRDCPRGCIWPVSSTTAEDRERFFGASAVSRIHVTEAGWLDRMRAGRLYAYQLPAAAFRPHEVVGGYWVADQPVDAVGQLVIDDLLGLARGSRNRTADHPVHLAVLAAGHRLDSRVQRLPAGQHGGSPGPVQLGQWAAGKRPGMICRQHNCQHLGQQRMSVYARSVRPFGPAATLGG